MTFDRPVGSDADLNPEERVALREETKQEEMDRKLTVRQLRDFCEVLKMGSDPEGLDILHETYPEIWGSFIFELESKDVLCDHDDYRFRSILSDLIGGFLED